MKNKFLTAIICFVIFSCNNNQVDSLKNEIDLLKTGSAKKDSVIKNFILSFNQIIDNLNLITKAEKEIGLKVKKNKKLSIDDKNKIMEEVKLINSLMVQNKGISDSLKGKFSTVALNFNELDKMLENLRLQVEEKNNEINVLKKNLGDVEITFNTIDFWLDALTSRNIELENSSSDQQQIIEKQNVLLNTAYFRYGTFKELKDAGILMKEKGLLSRGEKLMQNFSNNEFKKINIRETVNIRLPGGKMKIISNHTTGSFIITQSEKGNILQISDPEEFWKISKYLVILLD